MRKILVSLFWFAVALSPWINHLVYCFKTEKYLLLITGSIVAPVGWLHGLGLFFGLWG